MIASGQGLDCLDLFYQCHHKCSINLICWIFGIFSLEIFKNLIVYRYSSFGLLLKVQKTKNLRMMNR